MVQTSSAPETAVPQGWGRLSWLDNPPIRRCESCKRSCSSSREDVSASTEGGQGSNSFKKGSFRSLHRSVLEARKKHRSKDFNEGGRLQKSASNNDLPSSGLFSAKFLRKGSLPVEDIVDGPSPPALPSRNTDNRAFQPERPCKTPSAGQEPDSSSSNRTSLHLLRSNPLVSNRHRVPPKPPARFPPPHPKRIKLRKSATQAEIPLRKVSEDKNVCYQQARLVSSSSDSESSLSNATEQIPNDDSQGSTTLCKVKTSNKSNQYLPEKSSQLKRANLVPLPTTSSPTKCAGRSNVNNKDSTLKDKLKSSIRNNLFRRRSQHNRNSSAAVETIDDNSSSGSSKTKTTPESPKLRSPKLEESQSPDSPFPEKSAFADFSVLEKQIEISQSSSIKDSPNYCDTRTTTKRISSCSDNSFFSADSSDSNDDSETPQHKNTTAALSLKSTQASSTFIKNPDKSASSVDKSDSPALFLKSTEASSTFVKNPDKSASSVGKSDSPALSLKSTEASSTFVKNPDKSASSVDKSDSPALSTMSHHHHHGGAANYSTLRRGLKATTSRLMGASIRRPGLSPAISLGKNSIKDQYFGYR